MSSCSRRDLRSRLSINNALFSLIWRSGNSKQIVTGQILPSVNGKEVYIPVEERKNISEVEIISLSAVEV